MSEQIQEQRYPELNLETYVRMVVYEMKDQTGSLKHTRIIIPVSVKQALIARFESLGYHVLPQWFDGPDGHDNAVLFNVWKDYSTDTYIPVVTKDEVQYGEMTVYNFKRVNPNDGSFSLGH